ncbi:unnamed protein product [Schistosoma margrebowiei]|uniref:Uncharacterized protein n=1 Tax=Schistosoma margrebowiei TaxID=48269 RepID=A0A183LTQ6_9TREM|nr:unnamed protein product [Schistosoma margrebowiei]
MCYTLKLLHISAIKVISTLLGESSVSTDPVKAPDTHFLSSQFREEHALRERAATQRAVRAEEESENLAGELTILEDEANDWNEKSNNVQEQINMVRVTISEA